MKVKNLIGQRFNKLSVLSFSHKKKRIYFWTCQCDCGHKTVVRGAYLKNGHTKSCGYCILRTTNIIGKKFGKLTVIEYGFTDKHRCTHWKCICDCGQEKIISIQSLKRGSTISCGCYGKERRKQATRKQYGESSFNKLLRIYKKNAQKRNLLFSLSEEEFKKLTTMNCNYCNTEPLSVISQKHGYGNFTYNGIDRLNNQKGYELENCVPCCKVCNKAKNIMSKAEFTNWIKKVYLYYLKLERN